MDRTPRQGEFYRHFKNKLYQIIAIATHSETGEEMVVYQALYGDYKIYVRPLTMFVSQVDHLKYPDVDQQYRFEKVIFTSDEKHRDHQGYEMEKPDERLPEKDQPNSFLLDFLEAETIDEKLEALSRMKGKVGQRELDSLYVVLDIKPLKGTVEDQLDQVRRYLAMQHKYDGKRLR